MGVLVQVVHLGRVLRRPGGVREAGQARGKNSEEIWGQRSSRVF